jgi:hypothetical protein
MDIYKHQNTITLRDADDGIYAVIESKEVVLTTFTKGKSGSSETTVTLSRDLWNSLAGTSLQMAKESF